MPNWPLKWPSNEPQRAGATKKALRRMKAAQKNGATTLVLSNLKLRTLPEAIGQLSQLQLLSLSNNQLRTLPETVQNLETGDTTVGSTPKTVD